MDYYQRKNEQRFNGSEQYWKIFMWIAIALLVLSMLFSCSVIPHSPHYQYQYVRLNDGSTGYAQDIVQYDLGDTIEEIPSGKKFLITGVGVVGGKIIKQN